VVSDDELNEIKEKQAQIKNKAMEYGSWFVTGKI
jgi:hypothetical protein